MTDLNREIIAEEIYKSELYTIDTGGYFRSEGKEDTPTTTKWKDESETFREYRRLQADYLLTKFRMILHDDNDETPP